MTATVSTILSFVCWSDAVGCSKVDATLYCCVLLTPLIKPSRGPWISLLHGSTGKAGSRTLTCLCSLT
jgi:hypothetical protein